MPKTKHDNYGYLERLADLLQEPADELRTAVELDYFGSVHAHPEVYQVSGLDRAKLIRQELAQCIELARQQYESGKSGSGLYSTLTHLNTQLALLIGDYELP